MPQPDFAVRLRIYREHEIVLGPGKADLLELIAETGSISHAARQMEMSYKHAWSLVKAMNEAFGEPLVAREVGGSGGGGATLTPLGEEVLKGYRAAESAARNAADPHIRKLARRMRGKPPCESD